LYTVFENIIKNAISNSLYSTEIHTPYIEIKITSTVDEVILMIKDNGKGIEKNKIDKIFELYYRTEVKHNLESNGLGLYVVKSIIESLHGKIRVESKFTKGACFIISLPKFR
jgi:two-component system sensor histidine kinase VicK